MSVFIPEIDDIYFPKTKEYFKEVLSSYTNGNYRSATVMLYSVVVCDLMLQLKELKDMYNDAVATSILEHIDSSRDNANANSRAKWEKDLIEKVYKETKLLELEAYTHINHLYDDRNFSAHPAMNEDYNLISPSREETIANIKNMLNDVFIKPPIFIKGIVSFMTDDLQERKSTFLMDYGVLRTYLNNRYYSRMPESMKIATYKALWKFCFRSPDNENCMRNRSINRGALEILTPHIQKQVSEMMDSEPQLFEVADHDECIINLIRYFSNCPDLFSHMQSHIKKSIDRVLKKCPEYKAFSWFKYSSLQNHLDALKKDAKFDLTDTTIKHFESYYCSAGQKEALLDFYIWNYGKSPSFDSANQRYAFLHPFLKDLSKKQIIELLKVTNENRQVYDRWKATAVNEEIYSIAIEKLGGDFDFSVYPHFKHQQDTEETITPILSEDIPF